MASKGLNNQGLGFELFCKEGFKHSNSANYW